MLYTVNIKGRSVPIHAKNEAQLKCAIRAMTDVFEDSPDLMEEYLIVEESLADTPDTEQDILINSAAIGGCCEE